jgi:hypothetical protein
MVAGRDLRVEGTVSPKLLFNLNTYLIPLLRQVNPTLRPVRVSAASSTSVEPPAKKVTIAGLSNGVDSLTTVLDYLLDPQVPPALRIAYFVFNEWYGQVWRDDPETLRRAIRRRGRRASGASSYPPSMSISIPARSPRPTRQERGGGPPAPGEHDVFIPPLRQDAGVIRRSPGWIPAADPIAPLLTETLTACLRARHSVWKD